MGNFRNLLTQYKVSSPLLRLGKSYDGGYVVPEILIDKTDVLYTYGVGSDITFELDFLARKKVKIRLYDHTISKPPVDVDSDYINFVKEGLGRQREVDKNIFSAHRDYWEDGQKNILLKIDIDGGEYDYFYGDDSRNFHNVVGLIIELHNIGKNKERAISFLKEITKEFSLIHIHGNNYGCFFIDDGEIFPDTFELVFIKKVVFEEFIQTPIFNEKPLVNLDWPCNHFLMDFPNVIPPGEQQLEEIVKIFNSLANHHLDTLLNKSEEYIKAKNHIKHLNSRIHFLEQLLIDMSITADDAKVKSRLAK